MAEIRSCAHCGNSPIPADFAFCPGCGAALAEASPATPPRNEPRGSGCWTALLIVTACSMGVCTLTMFVGEGSKSGRHDRPPRPTVGEQVLTRPGGEFACANRDDLGEYLDSVIRQDAVARLSALRRGCRRLPDGARAVVLDVPAFTSDTQI